MKRQSLQSATSYGYDGTIDRFYSMGVCRGGWGCHLGLYRGPLYMLCKHSAIGLHYQPLQVFFNTHFSKKGCLFNIDIFVCSPWLSISNKTRIH